MIGKFVNECKLYKVFGKINFSLYLHIPVSRRLDAGMKVLPVLSFTRY